MPRPTRGQAHVLHGYPDPTGSPRVLYPLDKILVIRDLQVCYNLWL